MSIKQLSTDVLILRAGGAGLFAALHAKQANPALSADVKVLSTTGGRVNAYGKSQSLGFVKASTTTFAKLGSSANGDRGDFNSFDDSSGQTLDGSFMSFDAGGQCVFEASGIAS